MTAHGEPPTTRRGLASAPRPGQWHRACVVETEAGRGGAGGRLPGDVAEILDEPADSALYNCFVAGAEVLRGEYPGRDVKDQVYRHYLRREGRDRRVLEGLVKRWHPSAETVRCALEHVTPEEREQILGWGALVWCDKEALELVPQGTQDLLLSAYTGDLHRKGPRRTEAWIKVTTRLEGMSAPARETAVALAKEWEGEPEGLLDAAEELCREALGGRRDAGCKKSSRKDTREA